LFSALENAIVVEADCDHLGPGQKRRKQKAEDRYLTSENRHRTSVLTLWG